MKFVPYEKMSKKNRKKIDCARRKDWNGVNPATKIVPDKRLEILEQEEIDAAWDEWDEWDEWEEDFLPFF